MLFRSIEFEMDWVLKGGPWSFDNQVLLLTRWKVGMTADNVRFDLVGGANLGHPV